ncbi:MBL fold metallo-hydrolase [Arcicella rigui]|uniref:MBL fold metallo-hydrolase n=1 Tax=Arcicella rigui TaxID=797020 RepID=A0ABU5Q9R6_9BACT|nr:MBL fold metallo-hydrolase [Arcicella rigui]MEA5139363.1 MBL fold metallo-hydrolase [Arcicella rigui]
MIQVQAFTFNPFGENTYLLFDETKECVVVDPGCHNYEERKILKDFIEAQQLKVVHLLNTHAHIDHVLGNEFIKRTYNVKLHLHQKDLPLLNNAASRAEYYGFPNYEGSTVDVFIEEGDKITFGNSTLDILFVPGHAPGHVAFVNVEQNICISGDVLFKSSIGRTDFPLCSYEDLQKSIRTKLYTLPAEVVVYPGHGITTTIGFERKHNPFIKL